MKTHGYKQSKIFHEIINIDIPKDDIPCVLTAWKVSKYGVFSSPCFPLFNPNAGKYGPEKTPYWTLFMQCSVCLLLNHDFIYQSVCIVFDIMFKDFFSKCDQISCFLLIWSHLLKKSSMENFIFLCSVSRLVSVVSWLFPSDRINLIFSNSFILSNQSSCWILFHMR